jgi:hypothetical protein
MPQPSLLGYTTLRAGGLFRVILATSEHIDLVDFAWVGLGVQRLSVSRTVRESLLGERCVHHTCHRHRRLRLGGYHEVGHGSVYNSGFFARFCSVLDVPRGAVKAP